MGDISMWLLEYGTCTQQPVSSIIYGRHNAGTRSIPFTFLVIEVGGKLVAVDTGYYDEGYAHDLTVKFAVDRMRPIESALADIGVQGKDFDEVILTHAHYDHMGGIKAFPNARFCIQQRELFEWLKILALPKDYDNLLAAIDPADIRNLVDLLVRRRLTLVDGEVEDYLPGISLFPVFDSHTYGLQLVRIRDGPDDWVFTSDACLSFENLGQEGNFGPYSPVGFAVGNLTLMTKALDRIRVLSNNRLDRILMTHEDEMWKRFPSKVTSGGMHVAEICLASGKHSRL